MSVKATVAVGAQYDGPGIRFTVVQACADDAGPWALILAGSYRDPQRVQLRVDEPVQLRTGGTVRLVAVAPPPHPPAVALEITLPGGHT